jgi:hypothetical protein
MAQTNYTPIQLYYSTTAAAVPVNTNLLNGELAINITDGKLYYKDNSGTVQVIATKGAGTIGGSTTQIQYNNAGALAGSSAMVFDNSTNVVTLTTLNLTNALGAVYGGTGLSTYTTGDLLYSSASNTLAKLAIGTANYILTVNSGGTNVQWSAPSSISVSTATNLAGGVAGSVPYQSGASTTTFLGIGAADRVMTSSGSAPQWVTALTGLTGVSSSSITNTSLTSGRVVYSGASGVQSDSANLTFNGTTLSAGGFSTVGFSTLVKTVTVGNSNFDGSNAFAPATPAKLYIGTGTVTDFTTPINGNVTTGAITSLAITPIAADKTGVTYTNAATLYIAGAPSAGTNITITNPYALYVNAGASYLGGTLTAAGYSLVTLGGTQPAVNGGTVLSLRNSASAGDASRLNIVGGNTGFSIVEFSDTDANQRGSVAYAHSTDTLTLLAAGSTIGTLSSTGLAVTGTFSSTLGATIQTLTVGLGAGAVSNNTAVGVGVLQANSSGGSSTGVGYQALYSATSGAHAALGQQALYSNTSGTYNTAVGYQAGYSNLTGDVNTYIGRQAGFYQLNSYNTAIGTQSMYGVSTTSTGQQNTAVGRVSLYANTSGSYNTAIGHDALQSNTTASNNTAVGYQAGFTNQTGARVTALGYQAGYTNNASDNLYIGSFCGFTNSSGIQNTLIGPSAGYYVTGSYNTAVGALSLGYGVVGASGSSNTAIGDSALNNITSGGTNTALGRQAGYQTRAGTGNVFLGYQAGYSNQAGNDNTFVGNGAGYGGGQPNYGNVAVGSGAGGLLGAGGNYNTFIGVGSGGGVTTGGQNTIIGAYSGAAAPISATGSNFIVLSDGSGNVRGVFDSSGRLLVGLTSTNASAGNALFQISQANNNWVSYIENTQATGSVYCQFLRLSGQSPNDATSMFTYMGDTVGQRMSVKSNGGIYNYSANDSNLSDRREKTNFAPSKSYLDVICAIPVQTFNYIDQSEDDPGLTLGVVAQDVQAVAPELVMESNWAGKDEEPKMRLSIYQTDLQYALMKCIQEQQAIITQLTARITALEGA